MSKNSAVSNIFFGWFLTIVVGSIILPLGVLELLLLVRLEHAPSTVDLIGRGELWLVTAICMLATMSVLGKIAEAAGGLAVHLLVSCLIFFVLPPIGVWCYVTVELFSGREVSDVLVIQLGFAAMLLGAALSLVADLVFLSSAWKGSP